MKGIFLGSLGLVLFVAAGYAWAADKEPVAGAKVRFSLASSGTHDFVTDAKGNFVIKNIKPGRCVVYLFDKENKLVRATKVKIKGAPRVFNGALFRTDKGFIVEENGIRVWY